MMKRNLRGSTGDPELDAAARAELARSSAAEVCEVYESAVRQGARSLVMLVLDCADRFGGELARECIGHDRIEAELAAREGGTRPGSTMTVIVPADFEQTRRGMLATFPELEEDFTPAPPGKFLAVIVSSGGASIAEVAPT